MKANTSTLVWVVLFALWAAPTLFANAGHTDTDTLSFDQMLKELVIETAREHDVFEVQMAAIHVQLESVGHEIANTAGRNYRRHRKALEKKIELLGQLEILEDMYGIGSLKVRYRKGVDLIKLMYEKILGLDHHFTGMQTFQNIALMSNPNSFPEFQKTKELLERNSNKKYSMKLPSLLESNPFISASFMLISTFMGERSSASKQADFDKVACILDFTVRMNADLNVIRHETEFLKQANFNMKMECEKLFDEYCKAVGYHVPLEKCRGNDDWETLFDTMDKFMQDVEQQVISDPNGGINKDQVNVEFATQRVSDFIGKYSSFVSQGLQYYQKFDNIVSNYENEQSCQEQLPRQYTELKFDIKSTIDKFNNTYNLPEIQGSRLKDLLYGTSQGF